VTLGVLAWPQATAIVPAGMPIPRPAAAYGPGTGSRLRFHFWRILRRVANQRPKRNP
jgi:hypothetical protein